jgi:hypothetical protein
VPFNWGDPINTLISGNGVVFPQMVTDPLEPAFGAWFTVTVTVAVAVEQGACPGTVYV